MSGTASFIGPAGFCEIPFPASAIIRAGIVGLHPSQELKLKVRVRSDGAMLVDEIALTPGARAEILAEEERRSQKYEENYKLQLGRGIH
jgi:hypothetical protein